jgi:Acyl-CoA carboxylase epsilon subunit
MSAVELTGGGATPEEMAALVAVIASLGERRVAQDDGGYAAWRRQRLAALRESEMLSGATGSSRSGVTRS